MHSNTSGKYCEENVAENLDDIMNVRYVCQSEGKVFRISR